MHVLHRAGQVAALLLPESGMARPLQEPDVRVMAHDDMELAVAGCFLEKTHMAGVQPIVAAGQDDTPFRRIGRGRRERGKAREIPLRQRQDRNAGISPGPTQIVEPSGDEEGTAHPCVSPVRTCTPNEPATGSSLTT